MKRVTELGYIGPDGVRVYLGNGQVMTEFKPRGIRGLGLKQDDATEGRGGPARSSGSSGAGERGTNSGTAASSGAGSSANDVAERRERVIREDAAGAKRAVAARAAKARNDLLAAIAREAALCKANDRRACARQKLYEAQLRDLQGPPPAPSTGGKSAPAPAPPPRTGGKSAPAPAPASAGKEERESTPSAEGEKESTPPAEGEKESTPPSGRKNNLPTSANDALPPANREDSTKPPNGSTVMSETQTTPPEPEPQVVTPVIRPSGGGGGEGSTPPTQFAPPEDFKPPGDASVPPSVDTVERTEKEKTSGMKAGSKAGAAASTGSGKLLYVFGALGLAGVAYLAFKKKKSTGERT